MIQCRSTSRYFFSPSHFSLIVYSFLLMKLTSVSRELPALLSNIPVYWHRSRNIAKRIAKYSIPDQFSCSSASSLRGTGSVHISSFLSQAAKSNLTM